ncbi:lectin-like domain-containing protein [Roseibacillus ishigakijimensis]|uniref:Discoidin domain-containing protein n=1 Tax=Roseibacillus ishigakijimensis TaxID=454146 RepID=A0A934VLQ9_9BACT|nr:discoidin domain-containing protein [Roseibacillus ishigakijimensis]MBK1833150.1 discoidin domain-containing protein [Roseibacillus ishigakijimensis]
MKPTFHTIILRGSLLPLLFGSLSGQTETYQYYRFTTNALRGGGTENSVQISEFEMRLEGQRLTGATASNPGGDFPIGEPPASANDGDVTTKWLDRNKGPLVLDFGAPVTADAYRFATANDANDRDPISWTLEGSNDNSSWTLLVEEIDFPTTTARQTYEREFLLADTPQILQFERFDQIVLNGDPALINYEVRKADSLSINNGVGSLATNDLGMAEVTPPDDSDTVYTLTATNANGSVTATTTVRAVEQTERTFQYIRFTPLRLRETLPGQPAANSIQIAEFSFLHEGEFVTPVGATNPGGNNPETQQVGNLIDGNLTNKWLDFNKGPVIFDMGSPTAIDGYVLSTGGDAPERDPIAWLLEGSDDQSSWQVIDAIVSASYDPEVEFNYLLPDSRNADSPDIPLPAVINLVPASINNFEADPVILTDGEEITLSWDTALASSLNIDNGVGAVSANPNTTTTTPPDNSDTDYTLTVDNALARPATAKATVRTVTPGEGTYRYLRFSPTRLAESLPQYGGANSVQIAEMVFYHNGLALDHASLGTVVSNPLGNNPGTQGPGMIIDGDVNTKWLDFNKSPLVFDFQTAQTFDAYQWTTGGDAPERDVVAWRLDGSNDGSTWTVIDMVDKHRTTGEELAFFYNYPRGAALPIVPLPDPATVPLAPPVVTRLRADAPTALSGEPVVIEYLSQLGESATIDVGAGPVPVPVNGSYTFTPSGDTTVVLTVTSPAGSTTREFPVTVITPAITEICYENFDEAGEELSLLGAASIVNAYPFLVEPGDFARLRLHPLSGGQVGTAWFRARVGTESGFSTTFDLHIPTNSTGGADGASFILQNHPQGNVASATGELGLGQNDLSVVFDTWLNGGEASPAVIRVRASGAVLAERDLTTINELGLTDLTQAITSSPYRVQVGYTSGGLLSVYLNEQAIITDLSVDLAAIGAVNAEGKGYVGFSGRTGGAIELHDVTSWCYTEGEPVYPSSLELLDYSFDFTPGNESVTLTWTSGPGLSYRVVAGDNLADFPTELASEIAADGETTTRTIPLGTSSRQFLRIEQE